MGLEGGGQGGQYACQEHRVRLHHCYTAGLHTKDINEAPKGTGAYPGGEVDNPFKFTVDTRAPTVSTGKTGVSLKNPGVTSGDQ